MRNRLTFALIVVSLAGAIAVSAQATENFEVASVRPVDRPGGPQFGPCSGGVELTSGRVVINAATVYRLVTLAYGMYCPAATNLLLLSGGPDWMQKVTLRNLLADRFHLTLPERLGGFSGS